jgi:hypothetical protein
MKTEVGWELLFFYIFKIMNSGMREKRIKYDEYDESPIANL